MEKRSRSSKKPGLLRDCFLSALFPLRCHICDERFNTACGERENVFYGDEPIQSPLCPDCTQRLSALYQPQSRKIDENTDGFGLFEYNEETVRALIYHIKFCRCDACHAFVGQIAARAMLNRFPEAQAVVGIPRSVPLLKQYGFDQTERMLEQYAALPNSAPIREVLYRDKSISVQQKGLSARERRLNAFRSLKLKDGVVLPKTVCVLDDVVTTGSTALAASSLLREAGAEKICFFFLASTERL